MAYDIFISFPSSERVWVRALGSELERQFITFFLDEKDIQPGKNFVLALGDALQHSLFLVLILSKASGLRPWVEREWTVFTALHGPTDRILPVLLDSVPIPSILSPIQVIRAMDRDVGRVAQIIGSRVKESQTGVPHRVFRTEQHRDVAYQLAQAQASRFLQIRHYPFQGSDPIPVGDVLPLSAEQKAVVEGPQQRIPVSKLSEIHRACVLIGEPGAGKSTSLQQIAHDQAELYVADTRSLLPLYIDLKWWSKGLRDLLESTMLDLCPNLDAATSWQAISSMPVAYYMDSFDEAPDPVHLLREIKTFVSQNRESRFIVASRPNDLIGSLDFATYRLAPLNRAQILEILGLYLSPHFNAEQIWRIYEDVGRYGLFADLGNPMMLWFFCLAIRDAGSVEHVEFLAKGTIFHHVVERYFLSTWEPKSLKSWTPMSRRYTSIKAALLSKLAQKMLEEDDRIVVSEQWVLNEFAAHLANEYSNPLELAHELLDQILYHHLLERNAEQLSFWHKSLRDFFVARSLATGNTLQLMPSRAREVRWHEPIVMLASLDANFVEIINDVARANPVVGIDCVAFSRLSRDPTIVRLVVDIALNAFLSKETLDERVWIIQSFVALYRKAPDLIEEATWSFLNREQQTELKPLYDELVSRTPSFEEVVQQIGSMLADLHIDAKIETRIKTFGSFVRKASQIDVKKINDVFGMRVTVNTIKECYEALGYIHGRFKGIPGTFKDYIALPKSNMYQGLHTKIKGQSNFVIGVIIQTREMVQISQRTWHAYIHSEYGDVFMELENRQIAAGKQVIPLQSYVTSERKIVVFTPHDGLGLLEEDSTVLDLAYLIHSEIFQHCQGAIVNGKRVHIGHPLKNLDRVEVLCDPQIQPETAWLSFVRSTSARRKLRRILQKKEDAKSMMSAKMALDSYITEVVANTGAPTETVVKMIRRRFGCYNIDDVWRGIARGKYKLDQLPFYAPS